MKHGLGSRKSFSDPCSIRVSSVAKIVLDCGSDELHLGDESRIKTRELSTALPNGVVSSRRNVTEPFQGSRGVLHSRSQGSRDARQPWAMGCNSFGVMAAIDVRAIRSRQSSVCSINSWADIRVGFTENTQFWTLFTVLSQSLGFSLENEFKLWRRQKSL